MGRLFWKFFMAFWSVLLTTGLCVGATVWFHRPDWHSQDSLLATGPHVAFDIQVADSVLTTGGEEALRAFLTEAQNTFSFPLRVTDEKGRDLLGRAVSAAARARAEQMALHPDGPPVARFINLANGRKLLLFVPLEALPLGRPPMVRPMSPLDGPAPLPHGDRLPPPGGPMPPPPGPMPPGPSPWLPLFFGLLASLGVSAMLAWYVAKPIRHLRQALDKAARGHLDVRVQPLIGRRRDELAELGRHFDHMAQRLQRLMEVQRRLLHDVSHELRSPLARIQAAVGLACQHPDKAEESLERVEREAGRLNNLVGEVLTLARLESIPLGSMDEEIDMPGLLAEVVADARFEAQTKGVAIDLENCDGILIRGRAELIYRAVENVIRNAVRHTPVNGTVAVAARVEGSGPLLSIEVLDHGPGVPQEELSAIFEPFFRGGNRKSGAQKGYGLGLAIAQRAVVAHGGTIGAQNLPDRGFCVRIELPGLLT